MPTNQLTEIVVPPEVSGMRLDVYLMSIMPKEITRSTVQRAIKDGKIKVEEKQITKAGNSIHAGQTIRIAVDAFKTSPAPEVQANNEIPLVVLHEDPNLLVIDKQAGIPVHAGTKNEHPTIADALIARYPDLAKIGEDPLRPGIVHRLDKDTSGVMLIARTPEMFNYLKEQFQLRHVQKTYLALVRGVMGEKDGKIAMPIMRSTRNPMRRTVADKGVGRPSGRVAHQGEPRLKERASLRGASREAVTYFKRAERFSHYTLLEVMPKTGRTHQIRVHLSHIGFPIIGDNLYGKQIRDGHIPAAKRQFLHASAITITLPSGNIKTFRSPLPPDLQIILDELRTRKAAEHLRDKPVSHNAYRVSKH
jgi:23S rRNA pseudouridine1911/1915/1917 synthase